jgi:AcrR family transcriptional regulator
MAVAKSRNRRVKQVSSRKDTAERALEQAEKLLVRGGYSALSLDAIARALDIRTPSLYHHFPGGKEELLLAVGERRTIEDSARLREHMQAVSDPVDKLRAVAGYFATLTGHHLRHALAESRKELSPAARRKLQAHYAALIEAPLIALVEEAVASGQFRPCNPVAAVRAFLMLMLSLGEFEADDPLRAQLPEFLVELFAFGLVLPDLDLAAAVRKPRPRRKNN